MTDLNVLVSALYIFLAGVAVGAVAVPLWLLARVADALNMEFWDVVSLVTGSIHHPKD